MRPAFWFWLAIVSALSVTCTVVLFAIPAQAAEAAATTQALGADPSTMRWAFVAAAAVTGISSLAAAFAVARVGSAAIGALAEKPELFGRMLVLVGLAEGIAIYGLLVSILILNRLG